ncbi:hypothetical protein GCM10025863_08600 [Microbacterium suwonense]|uniref:AAA+ ATPase domain-containing protein n=1 Tax=Microbacterium suwonense TaxID=683047 RepID=A0ABM8FS60_9MICO|nr:hypothetical protein GCM10025863_08600 [Microbacterium suwonense]
MTSAPLLSGQTPLAVRMRPVTLDEVAGQAHLLRAGSPIVALADPDASSPGAVSIILWGPPGTGKTTLAQAIARSSGRRFVELSAITAGVKDVREVMQEAITNRDLYGQTTILFLDEIHRFTKAQQDALLPGVENGWVILIAATTENPSFSVISPLLSRSLLLTLQPLTDDDIGLLVDRAVSDARGLAGAVAVADDARASLIHLASGDARRALTGLEAAASVAMSRGEAEDTVEVSADDVAQAVDRALLRYDRQGDEHYDVISAFIKSIRGSDPDAAVHYLARMIEAGEDPRFIARRLVISAAEDIGLADPQALTIATAAADAVAFIGMPEGRIPSPRRPSIWRPQRNRMRRIWPSTRRSPTYVREASDACRSICATRTMRARNGSATARDTGIRTTAMPASCPSSICRTSWSAAATTSRRTWAPSATCPLVSSASGGSSADGETTGAVRTLQSEA